MSNGTFVGVKCLFVQAKLIERAIHLEIVVLQGIKYALINKYRACTGRTGLAYGTGNHRQYTYVLKKSRRIYDVLKHLLLVIIYINERALQQCGVRSVKMYLVVFGLPIICE